MKQTTDPTVNCIQCKKKLDTVENRTMDICTSCAYDKEMKRVKENPPKKTRNEWTGDPKGI